MKNMPLVLAADPNWEHRLKEMNAALLVSSVRQHELTQQAEKAEAWRTAINHELVKELAATERLHEISTRLIEIGKIEVLYQDLVEAAADLMSSDMSSVQAFDRDKKALRMLAYHGFDPDFGQVFEWVGMDSNTSCGMAMRSGRRVVVPDVNKFKGVAGTPICEAQLSVGICATQSTPLLSRSGRLLGMITTHWRYPHNPAERDLRRFDILARQAADLTERMQTESALRASEDRYRTLFDLGPVAIYSIDAAGVVRDFNRHAAKLWGRRCAIGDSEERFCGAYKLFRPDGSYLRHDECPMAEVVAGRIPEVRDAEVLIERPDGSRVTVVVNIQPLKNPRGEVIGAVNCFYDVTDRKVAEVAKARLAAIVESSDDAIISKDLHGVITSWNRGAKSLFGYTADEVIGKHVSVLIPEDHLDEEPEILARIRRGESVEHYETVRRRKDGSLLNISLTISPIRDSAGQVIGASKVARDITESVSMERRIQQQNEALAGESRRKDEFLAMLSHELRNPLAPICSAVHVLKTHERGTENIVQKQAREIIERQVGNLTKLISDLLEVSRVVSGQIRLDRQVVDLNKVVEHAIQTAMPLIEQRKHTLTVHRCGGGAWVNADATRMEEVFINLVNNAAKYTSDGGKIEVHCEHDENYVLTRVRDNGIGINEELLPRIFDLFTQGDCSLDRAAGGLGIGLSVAQRLVGLQGGTIEVHSPPAGASHGSEFAVRLPLVRAPEEPLLAAPTVQTLQNVEGVRVLVVDDNIDSVTMLTRVLRDRGYSVQSAYSGPDGLEAAMQWRPDIALMDIGLPRLDGYELARRLRENIGERIRLIALTGYGLESDIAQAREAGFNDHLVKPYDFDELEKRMVLRK